jgi:hypothetical protein
MTWFTVTEYLCHKWPQICSACCNHNPILSSFMTYHRVCDKSNMTGATYGAWTAYPSCAPDHEFTPQVFSGICVAWSLVFCVRFCRLLFVLFLLAIALSVLWFTASDCPFGIFWTLCCLFCNLRLLIAPLVSFGHCVVCPVIYGFWLPLWYLLDIAFSVLWFTASDCPFGIFWPLCCLSCDLRLLIAPLVSFGHCVVCPVIYGFWLPLWYLLAIVLSVLWFTASDCPFGIFKLFYYLCQWF